MTWEEAPISERGETCLHRINKEEGLKYHSISLDREMHEMDKSVKGTTYSASLIIGGNDIVLPFLSENRATDEISKRGPDFPYTQEYMTFLGLNRRTDRAVYYNFNYSEYRNTPYFTITANHERAQEYFDIIADAHFASEQLYIKYYESIPRFTHIKHLCKEFIYICPETGKEFIKENPYL